MQLGMIGLGRMGGNIVRRLISKGHEAVVFDRSNDAIAALASEGAAGSTGLADLVKRLAKPRAVWVMLPAGAPTEGTIMRPCRDAGGRRRRDRRWQHASGRTTSRRAGELAKKDIDYVDVGTSGGVWGLERGYCMMIGGKKETVSTARPDLRGPRARAAAAIPATPGREGRDPRPEKGYIHAGPSGAGHFVKMVHNGIEYGLMQAYAEGFDILRNAATEALPADERFDLDVGEIAEVWRRGSVITSWLLDLTAAAMAADQTLVGLFRLRRRFRRGPLDCPGRHRAGCPGGGADRGALCPLPLAPGAHLCRKDPVGHAQGLRRPHRRQAGASAARGRAALMAGNRQQKGGPGDPCCFVIFGATGDLTKRLLVPALYNLAASGLLPDAFAIVGVVRTPLADEEFRADIARRSEGIRDPQRRPRHCRPPFLRHRVGAETNDPDSFRRLGVHLQAGRGRRGTPAATASSISRRRRPPSRPIVRLLAQTGLTQEDERQPGWRRVIVEKPFGTDLDSARALNRGSSASSRKSRSSGWITILERRRSRTS